MIVIKDQLLGPEDDAAEDTALAVYMFGCRINHAVGAKFKRTLVEGRREYVINYEFGAGIVCDVRNRGDIDHLQRRIGWRLQKEGLGVFLDRFLPGVEIGAIDQRRRHSEARQPFLDDPSAGPEQR